MSFQPFPFTWLDLDAADDRGRLRARVVVGAAGVNCTTAVVARCRWYCGAARRIDSSACHVEARR